MLSARTLKNPNQRHVATGGEEDHQPHSKTQEHPISSVDDGKSTMPDQRLVAVEGGWSSASSQNHETSNFFYG